ASREISSLRASTAKIPRLAALARDDDNVVVHTADSDDNVVVHTADSDGGAYSVDKSIRPTRPARSE
ncbi:hypothetical protein, partial [Bifidobacterium aquikefiri]